LSIVNSRWLKPHEIYSLLTNPEFLFNLGINFETSVRSSLPSGSFILWDREVGKNKWKKDGHEWVYRANTHYVREDRADWFVNKEDLIGLALFSKENSQQNSSVQSCNSEPLNSVNESNNSDSSNKLTFKTSYTKGLQGSTKTSETMKRRAYWIPENSKIIIIHYLDEALANKNQELNKLEWEMGGFNPPYKELIFTTPHSEIQKFNQVEKANPLNEYSELKSLWSDIEIDSRSPKQDNLMVLPNYEEQSCKSMAIQLKSKHNKFISCR